MKKIIIVIMSCFLLIGCGNETKFSYKKIDSKEALQIIEEHPSYIVIDVRTREEFAEGHIDGAFNIPYDEITDLIDFNKDTVLFVYCKSGKRSKIAAETLLDLGYEVYDLGAFEEINLEE